MTCCCATPRGSLRQAYGDIFAITCIKTVAVFVVIAFFYLTALY